MATIYEPVAPLIAGTAFVFGANVFSQSTGQTQTSVTLANGDVTVFRDGVSLGNIDALPVETGTSGLLVVTLSVAETTGCVIEMGVKFSDAAGAEWDDIWYYARVQQAVTVSESTAIEIADAILKRDVANVEATASTNSLTELILAALKSDIVDALQTIYETDGVTTFNTRTVTLDEDAKPITGVT